MGFERGCTLQSLHLSTPPELWTLQFLNEFMKVSVRDFLSELSMRASHAESCDFSISEIQYKSEHRNENAL